MVELVLGYGVVLSQRQIDESIDNSNNSPTRLIRHLTSAFFTKEIIATSSALGGRKYNALDKDIVAACLSELLMYIIDMASYILSTKIQDSSNQSTQWQEWSY